MSLQELPPEEQKEFPREQARLLCAPGWAARASSAQALRRQAGGFPQPPPEEELEAPMETQVAGTSRR